MAELCCEKSTMESISCYRQRTKSEVYLLSECIQAKHDKPCVSFSSNLHSLCGMVWNRPLRVEGYSKGLRLGFALGARTGIGDIGQVLEISGMCRAKG